MKKSILTTLAILFVSSSFFAQTSEETFSLNMTITNLESAEGTLGIRLLDANEKMVKQLQVDVNATTIDAAFEDVAEGTYAIQYYHDANSNGEMDFAWYGAPAEGYGNSNDVKGVFGPPEFEKQLFEIKSDKAISMKTIN